MLQPHVDVPRRLLEQPAVLKCTDPDMPGADGYAACSTTFHGDLPYAIAGVDELRRTYYEKMRNETALSNVLLASLIPLSAYALYRGIAHEGESTQNLLLKTGLIGSAAYAGVTMFTSKPRQVIYIAGSDALGCAMLASRPYLFTTSDMGDARTRGTFLGDVQFLRDRIAALEVAISNAQALSDAARAEFDARPKVSPPQPVDKPAPAAKRTPDPKLSSDSALNKPESKKRLADFNARLGTKVQPARAAPAKPEPERETQMREAPELAVARARLEEARRVLAQGVALRGQIDIAGSRLRDRALQINNHVSREILKTAPDPSSIFSVVGSIGQNAFRLTGAAALKSTLPVAQAKGPIIRYSLDDNEKARSALRNATDQVVSAAAAVAQWVQRVDGLTATVGTLAECRFTAPGATLTVTPDVATVEMHAPSSMSFMVSGGTGIPRATVVGGRTSSTPAYALSIQVDASGTYVATFSLTKDATVDDRPVIVFTDGSGNLKHQVAVTVIAAGAGENQGDGKSGLTKIPDKAEEPPPAIAPAPAPAAASDCTKISELRTALGMGPGDLDAAMSKNIVACKKRLGVSPIDERLNPPEFCTRVISKGECKP
jgi:hypothetical protein